MNHQEYSPEHLASFGNNIGNKEYEEVIRAFLVERSSKDILEFISKLSIFHPNKFWIEPANLALQLKRSEEIANNMTAQMNKLIEHTEKLTIQTNAQIKNSKSLSGQTSELINESHTLTKYTKSLKLFTILLFIVALLQVVLWFVDYHDKHANDSKSKFNLNIE